MVKEGYKETKVVTIPGDWTFEKLKNLCTKITDGTHKTPRYTDSGIPFLRVTDIHNKEVDWNNVKYISLEEHQELIKRCKPEVGDILYSKNGTIGIPKIIDWDREFSIFVSLCLIKVKEGSVDRKFLEHYLSSDNCKNQIKLRSKQGTVTNLHLEEIRELSIALPQIDEQQSIADILSTTDAHIERLDKLIEDYQLLKKGVMKKLLTEGIGHTEFKDTEIGRIPKDWEIIELSQAFEFYGGYSIPRGQLTENGSLYVHYGDIHTRTRAYIDAKEDSSWLPRVQVPKEKDGASLKTGDIVFADASEDYDGVGKAVVIYNDGLDIVAGLHTIVAKEKYALFATAYKKYFLSSQQTRNQFKKLATGSKVYGISKGNIGKIIVPVPTIYEQNCIAELITNLDISIEFLEIERQDFIQLKKGLMEKLLTGKIRATELKSMGG